jgi:hypothetical protein
MTRYVERQWCLICNRSRMRPGMKRLVFIAFLVLCGGPAYAEWIEFAKSASGGMTGYYDPDTIRVKGYLRRMWILYDHTTPQVGTGYSYLSAMLRVEYDCSEEHVRTLALTAYAGNMRNGKVVHTDSDAGTWTPVAPGTFDQSAWNYVCGKQ